MTKVLTHLAAFVGGALATVVAGLVVCELVENIDTSTRKGDDGEEIKCTDFAD